MLTFIWNAIHFRIKKETTKGRGREEDRGVTQTEEEDDEFVCIDENINEGIHSSDDVKIR